MQSDQQPLIIQDEPLKVLGLFPKRAINRIVFDEQKYLKLYNTLCCTICQQLFNNPVYLKCSHRFCKDCLEKYIRVNDKKSCPNCRGQLSTKRDLKLDFGISSLINYAYGNRNKFCQSLQQLENIESQNIHKLSISRNIFQGVGLIRGKSFAEQEPKSPKKRVKTFDGQRSQQEQVGETRGRKKKIQKITEQSSKQIPLDDSSRTEEIRLYQGYQSVKISEKLPKTDDTIVATKNQQLEKQQSMQPQYEGMQKTDFMQEPFQVVKKKRGRKKKEVPILAIQNKSADLELSQITNNNNINPQQNQMMFDADQQNVERVKEIDQERLTEKKTPSFSVAKNNLLPELSQKVSPTKPQVTIQTATESFQKEKKLLKSQFGEDYMLKMMRIPILDFLIEIKIQRHPKCYFTPIIQCKSIQLAGKCKIHQVYVLLSKFLNVEIKNIKLYVGTENGVEELAHAQSHTKTVIQINETYWKSAVDVQIFDMKEILSALDQNNLRNDGTKTQSQTAEQSVKKKKLFQNIEVEREKALQPRKRGRGRTRKIQEKENIPDIEKKQYKRILYYRLVIQ